MILLSGKDRVEETKERIATYKKQHQQELSSFSFYFFSDKEDLGSFYYLRSLKRILESFSLPYEEGFYDREKSEEENRREVKKHAGRRQTRIFRPLPTKREKEFLSLLQPGYDPDRLSLNNLGRLFSGDRDYLPATVKSIRAILHHYPRDREGKRAAVIGRSLSLGLPCFLRLGKENRTVSLLHSHSRKEDREDIIKKSSLLVLASGKKGLVPPSCLNKDRIVIDCGFEKGGELGYLPSVYAYTPVPGGVGALTPYYLIRNAREEAVRKK